MQGRWVHGTIIRLFDSVRPRASAAGRTASCWMRTRGRRS
jgi:hypothetical protein